MILMILSGVGIVSRAAQRLIASLDASLIAWV